MNHRKSYATDDSALINNGLQRKPRMAWQKMPYEARSFCRLANSVLAGEFDDLSATAPNNDMADAVPIALKCDRRRGSAVANVWDGSLKRLGSGGRGRRGRSQKWRERLVHSGTMV
jgi:hypothetical protein